jgi:hypothetical protein
LLQDPDRRRTLAAAAVARGATLDVSRAVRDVEAVYREVLER